MKRLNLEGQRFGRLLVEGQAGKTRRGTLWRCRCDCGNVSELAANTLTSGNSKSCGCGRRKADGMARSALYGVWATMHQRCKNPAVRGYKFYGARGITVCERWSKFEHFWEDMGPRPPGLSLDRIDHNGPYAPENCRWLSTKGQCRNTRANVFMEFNGKRQCATDWAKETGASVSMILRRLKRGWPVEAALSVPAGTRYCPQQEDALRTVVEKRK